MVSCLSSLLVPFGQNTPEGTLQGSQQIPQMDHLGMVWPCELDLSPMQAWSRIRGREETQLEASTLQGFWAPNHVVSVILFGLINFGVGLDLGDVLT